MSRESELAELLSLHGEWLASDNKRGKRADLSGAHLEHIDLSNTDLSGALFHGASLEGANLKGSTFFHCDFTDANLKDANLSEAILVLADFTGANLENANLAKTGVLSLSESRKNRRGPRFIDANLRHTNLHHAYCVGSDFSGANLDATQFSDTNLEQATFAKSDLSSLDFSRANLTNAKLQECLLRKTNMQQALLVGANLQRADLSQADLRSADLTSTNIEHCKLDGLQYNRRSFFRGIRLVGSYGSSRFIRFAKDQEFIEEFREAHPLAYIVWLGLTDCGRSMVRVALWSQVLSILFGLIYFSLGPDAFQISNPDGLKWSVFTTIYYSVVTFTTLGFGDITPNTPLAASIVIVEVVIGYMMLGILISILATKVARRS